MLQHFILPAEGQELVTLICNAVPVEAIYFLGSTITQTRTPTVFTAAAPTTERTGQHYLLALIKRDKGYSENYVQDRIETACKRVTGVTAIVLDIAQFTAWLGKGYRFACTVQAHARLLYEADGAVQVAAGVNDGTERLAEEQFCMQGINKVNEFIAGAELYCLRKQHKMAAFMLHQAAEHGLLTIFKRGTGLQVNTHNLDKLVRYCGMVTERIGEIFFGGGNRDGELFGLLQRAYIDTRYKDEYGITGGELGELLERVKGVREVMGAGMN